MGRVGSGWVGLVWFGLVWFDLVGLDWFRWSGPRTNPRIGFGVWSGVVRSGKFRIGYP